MSQFAVGAKVRIVHDNPSYTDGFYGSKEHEVTGPFQGEIGTVTETPETTRRQSRPPSRARHPQGDGEPDPPRVHYTVDFEDGSFDVYTAAQLEVAQ